MYFSKIKNISIALCLALPITANAAGLGQLTVGSGIGEPFRGTIELLSATPAELATLKASLASEEAYLTQGIERTADHKNIKINIGSSAGKKVLKLSSRQPVTEPFVDMLVVLEWANGRIVRQYTALLDPPGYEPKAAATANTLNNASVDKSKPSVNNDTKRKATTAAKRAPKTEHKTRRGDNLSKIARRMRPNGVSLDKVLVALFEANPQAFDGKNMNRLKVGVILQAPSEEVFNAVTRKRAAKEIKLQTADWNKYRNKLAGAVAARAAKANGEDTQSSSGKIKSAAEDQSAPKGNAPKDVVKLSTGNAGNQDADMQAKLTALQEEVSAREKGLKDAEEKTALLEKQVADMQKLLALKNDAMLEAQQQSAETVKSDVAAEPKSENMAEGKVEEPNTTAEAAKPVAKVEAKKPEVVKPKAAASAKTKPVPEAKQPSFLSSLWNTVLGVFQGLNKMILGAAVGLVALLLAAWLYFRNKRSKKLEDFEQGIMTSGSLKASTVFGDTATGNVNTGDTSFLTDFSQSTTNGLIDTNDVDPIAEAEVYMAYGRDEQAEEILKDAISKEPQRYELHLKLLDMYAANKNTSAFEALAGEMYATLGAEDPTWAKVAELGRKFDPSNPLYQVKESVGGDVKAEEAGVESPAVAAAAVAAETLTVAEEVVPDTLLDSERSAEGELDASDFADSPLAAEADLDFSVSDSVEAESVIATDASTEDVFDVDSSALDIPNVDEVLGTSEDSIEFNQPDEASLAVDEVNLTSDENVPDESAASLDFPTLQSEAVAESIEVGTEATSEIGLPEVPEMEIPEDLSLDMPEAESAETIDNTQEVASEADDGASLADFDFGLDAAEPVDTEQAKALDLSDISLEIADEGIDTVTESASGEDIPLTPAFEEVETKLELVAAYIDMEDKDGAKELLEEVLKEGNLSQRKKADEMLASL